MVAHRHRTANAVPPLAAEGAPAASMGGEPAHVQCAKKLECDKHPFSKTAGLLHRHRETQNILLSVVQTISPKEGSYCHRATFVGYHKVVLKILKSIPRIHPPLCQCTRPMRFLGLPVDLREDRALAGMVGRVGVQWGSFLQMAQFCTSGRMADWGSSAQVRMASGPLGLGEWHRRGAGGATRRAVAAATPPCVCPHAMMGGTPRG